MTVRDGIIQMIRDRAYLSFPITEGANLYTDLGFDSLSFIRLLTEIEERYAVDFEISEMQMCLEVGYLFAAVERKIMGGPDGSDSLHS